MSKNLLRPLGNIQTRRAWFEVAKDLKNVQDELAADLETALNACKQYQRYAALNERPDPSFVAVRQLLTKYKMDYVPATKTARVYVDGNDITEHPDSIQGSIVEDFFLSLEEADNALARGDVKTVSEVIAEAWAKELVLDDDDIAAIHEALQG